MNNVCPVEHDTIRYYAALDRRDDLQAEVNRYVKIFTEDRQGINTLRYEDSSVEDLIDLLVLEVVTHPIDSRTIEQVKIFRLQMFVAAAKLAGRKIAEDIKAAQEDHAVERFMWRQEARCEP